MDKFLNEKVKEFWGGFIVGGLTGVKLLFTGDTLWGNLAIEYLIRFFGAIILAFVSGIATVLAVDIYKHKIKPRFFPPKKTDDKNKFSDN